jgi:hypothetical protein
MSYYECIFFGNDVGSRGCVRRGYRLGLGEGVDGHSLGVGVGEEGDTCWQQRILVSMLKNWPFEFQYKYNF